MANTTQALPPLLSGDDLRGMFTASLACLEQNVDTVNALNVFPVPDGDTGTNMLLTLKPAAQLWDSLKGLGVSDLAEAVAQETLMSARGNSGVILSQFYRGWAAALQGKDSLTGEDVAMALHQATSAAYKAVSSPVEGTILTVIKEAARAAEETVASGEVDPRRVWESACVGARKALAETPDLLPVLKEAGVVDAGGLGFVALMEGGRAYLRGEEIASLGVDIGQVSLAESYLASTEQVEYGYCTQFLLQGTDLDVEEVRGHLVGISNSTVVVGDAKAIKVHVHVEDPGPVISYAVKRGNIAQVKIDNMDDQHQEFLDIHRGRSQEIAPIAVVVVASGDGITQVFRQLGAAAIVHGGQTMNPSTKDVLDHVYRAGASEVIVLPNNPNIVSAVQQAATMSSIPVHVLPTISIPQGVAALLAFNPDMDASSNLKQMQVSIKTVQSGEVTNAVRATSIDGHNVRKGAAIALLDGSLIATARTIRQALEEMCVQAGPTSGALITLYWGGKVTEKDAKKVGDGVRARCPGVEVQLVYGGQPYYDYLVSIE
jgi:DAK2 domain fusion protein YloV